MLACARLGAAHRWCSGILGRRLRDRINDAEAKVLITQGGVRRQGGAAQEERRRRRRRHTHPSRRWWCCGGPATTSPGPTTATSGTTWSEASRPTACRRRWTPRTALPALHLGDHGQAQGDHAHHRRVPDRVSTTHRLVFDPYPTPTSTGARPTSAGSGTLPRHVRPAGQPRHQHPLRGRAQLPPTRTAGGRSSRSARSRSSTRRRRPSAPS